MIVAVNKDNKELIPDNGRWVCNQGKLLIELSKNPEEEVLLDKDLPGDLRIVDLMSIINRKYPLANVSIISKNDTIDRDGRLHSKSSNRNIVWVNVCLHLICGLVAIIIFKSLSNGCYISPRYITYVVVAIVMASFITAIGSYIINMEEE